MLLQLFVGFLALPILGGLTLLFVKLRRMGTLGRGWKWTLILLMWGVFLLLVFSELHWMFVEEPARIKAGLPID